ncbi:hypothetical protein IWX90DRAFT_138869 [Phyllosticta citrichinensis]|uniref:Uncharacterized protein n=1 Tax=Phyllosticta citrichinensis TaxID=1130410 RepID=A0ABR1XYE4_9PEZI
MAVLSGLTGWSGSRESVSTMTTSTALALPLACERAEATCSMRKLGARALRLCASGLLRAASLTSHNGFGSCCLYGRKTWIMDDTMNESLPRVSTIFPEDECPSKEKRKRPKAVVGRVCVVRHPSVVSSTQSVVSSFTMDPQLALFKTPLQTRPD